MCLYDTVYQILNISSQMYYLTIANVIVTLPLDEKRQFLSKFINAQMKIWTSIFIFCTYHIWTNADRMGFNSDMSLNININLLCMGGMMALANLHISTCSTEPSICHTAISTKIKCSGSFYFFFTLNQA